MPMIEFKDVHKWYGDFHVLKGIEESVEQGEVLATIENKPGQTGSLAVYAALAAQHAGRITPEAAALGLEWYAEHTADARAHPGKHPNIDRLLDVLTSGQGFTCKLIAA